jgi:hypothetical protein
VPPNARACPECGADEETGWSEEAWQNESDLPDDEFDYEGFIRREFEGRPPDGPGVHWFWWLVGLLLLGVLLVWWIRW